MEVEEEEEAKADEPAKDPSGDKPAVCSSTQLGYSRLDGQETGEEDGGAERPDSSCCSSGSSSDLSFGGSSSGKSLKIKGNISGSIS